MRMLRAAVPLLTLALALAACSSTGGGATPAASAQAPTRRAAQPVRRRRRRHRQPRRRDPGQDPHRRRRQDPVRVHRRHCRHVRLHRRLREQLAAAHLRRRADARHGPRCRGLRDHRGDAARTRSRSTATRCTTSPSDTAPGQTNGQGNGGKWFVVDADGNTIGAAASPAASAAASPSAAAAAPTVALADNALGKVLVGADGKTLYVFTADKDGKSACTGDCAGQLAAADRRMRAPTLGTGLDAEDFKTITREDGSQAGHVLRHAAVLLRR